ncbi:MAG: histidine--tRNA ligase [Verrucomicrobia bacterium]|nr:MAG: histidine--tRNA ligase [Verrucomicrobiota bacterium]
MQPLTGFRDFLPAACAERNYIFAKWREVAGRYGFVEFDGPVLEELDLYKKKSGDEIVRQLYEFVDKGERAVALRPEMTPTLARIVAEQHRQFRKPLKWFSIPQVFRYERPQRGRLREHFQLNCDIVGEEAAEADAELIALAIDVVRAFGFTAQDFVIRISDREFWTELLKLEKVPPDRWEEMLQAIDKSEREPREKTEERLGKLAKPVFEIFERGGESVKLNNIMEKLRMRGLADFAKIDVRIVRGLAYYTGIVFEVFDRAGKLRAIAGGGRYDQLVAQLSDDAVSFPALGFAIGDVVLGEMIRGNATARAQMEKTITRERDVEIYVVVAKEEQRGNAMTAIQQLRDTGYRVDYSLATAKIARQFRLAEQTGARFAIVFGDEWPQVGLKDLRSGQQKSIAHDELLPHLESLRGSSSG